MLRLLAAAVYDIRLQLSNYLGNGNESDLNLREAAHLSYALHDAALQIMEGNDYDLDSAINRIRAIGQIIPGSELPARILGDRPAD